MKKLWCFVEGDSEEYFIVNLIRKKYYTRIRIERDLSEFVNIKTTDFAYNLLYCENCGSVNKIPHRINEWYYLVERSNSKDIFIICDVERKLGCPPNRRHAIESKLLELVNKNYLKYIFFNPMIEDSFWDCRQKIESIIKKEFQKKFPQVPIPEIYLPENEFPSIDDLKKCFKNYDLKYREAIFAKEYFPRVDFDTCENGVLKRTIKLIDNALGNKQ